MIQICIVNLIGLPASGKTTFCHRILKYSENFDFNSIHICFDDFISIEASESSFFSKLYKRLRFSLISIVQQMICDIRNGGNFEMSMNRINIDFPHSSFKLPENVSKQSNFVILIDDNMYYKSMRKEIRNMAKFNKVNYSYIYFPSTLEFSLAQNANRPQSLSENHIQNMFNKLEPPELMDGHGITFNIYQTKSSFICQLNDLIKKQYGTIFEESSILNASIPVEQSKIHKCDLNLRKEINTRMKSVNCTQIDKTVIAKMLRDKRVEILNQLRKGILELPNDLEELKLFLL